MVRFLVIISFISFAVNSIAQDSIPEKKDKWAAYEHKPKRAVLWSLLPGAGQIYNEIGYRRVRQKKHRAWWKVPIIYGGLGVCAYYFWENYSQGKLLKEEIQFRREYGDSTNLHPSLIEYSTEFELINGYTDFNQNEFQGFDLRAKRRDIFIAATIGVYAFNLIEAYVDGHFVSFDVSDDLSMRFMPVMFDRYSPGMSLQFNFK
jgi:Family of unknown function (DUF5683)